VYAIFMLFTTSWDDGYALDRTVAGLLSRHGLTGTFYVCPQTQHGAAMLREEDLRAIAAAHELGAHSMTHPRMSLLPLADVKREMAQSKAWVETVTGKACAMFCYPFGDHNERIRACAREAGFLGARTTEDLRFASDDPFAMPTTLQVMPFPWRRRWSRAWHPLDPLGPLRARWKGLRELGLPLFALTGWLPLAKALFTMAKKEDRPFFHLWGHSQEIERLQMWKPLEAFLEFVAAEGVDSVPNSALIHST